MKKDLHILLADGNNFHAVMIQRELTERFPEAKINRLTKIETLLLSVAQSNYDIAIIDADFSGLGGSHLIELIRKENIDLPIIMVTSDPSELMAGEAIRTGAAEVIIKQNSFHQIIPRVVGEVFRRKILIHKNRELEKKLKLKEQKDLVKIAASTLAHEINNPLMVIMGAAELILEDTDPQDVSTSKHAKAIRKSAEKISTALTRLANLATPNVNETVSGTMIDPFRSRIYTRRRRKSTLISE